MTQYNSLAYRVERERAYARTIEIMRPRESQERDRERDQEITKRETERERLRERLRERQRDIPRERQRDKEGGGKIPLIVTPCSARKAQRQLTHFAWTN